jgi:hypothetical protein
MKMCGYERLSVSHLVFSSTHLSTSSMRTLYCRVARAKVIDAEFCADLRSEPDNDQNERGKRVAAKSKQV